MSSRNKILFALTVGLLPWSFGASFAAEDGEKGPDPAAIEFFENEIRPALVGNCAVCHSGAAAQGGLRLDFRGGWEQGSKSGPAIVRGDPDNSPLIRAIRHEDPAVAMPLGGKKLDPDVIAAFERWVSMGAPDPRDAPSSAPVVEKSWEETFNDRSRWWSLQPVVRPPVPGVKQAQWSDQAVDRFILAKLEAKGLGPAPRAGRADPVPAAELLADGPAAHTRGSSPPSSDDPRPRTRTPSAVDRLLASPHFGERWARYWMDVVRYTDTYGYEWDIPAKGAWRFRDYLIRAFNADIPFDQLLREQIAGDLLPHPRINTSEQVNESLIGPMFYQMGEKRHGDSVVFNGIYQEMLDNKIDAFSKAFQAMTVACARCHNHKLDAISQKDYYALGGVFLSSRWLVNTVDTPDRNRKVLDELSALKAKLRTPLAAWWLEGARDIPLYLRAAQARIDVQRQCRRTGQRA